MVEGKGEESHREEWTLMVERSWEGHGMTSLILILIQAPFGFLGGQA